MGNEKWHKLKFEKSTKNDSIEFRKQKKTKKTKQNKQTKNRQNGNQIFNQQIAKM